MRSKARRATDSTLVGRHRTTSRHAREDAGVLTTASHVVLAVGDDVARRVRRPGTWLVLAAAVGAGLLALATTTVVRGDGPAMAPAVIVADTAARQQAADRADRAARSTLVPLAGPTPTATPGPAAAAGPASTPGATTTAKPTPTWVNPLPGATLTSCYGSRWGTVHQGIDLALAAGTPILAVGAGTVLGAGWLYAGYGQSVMIDHGNGIYSHYAHASKVLVKAGDTVVAGQPIALEGSTGDATGPHLHFEIHLGLWHQVDPAPWLRAHGVPIGC